MPQENVSPVGASRREEEMKRGQEASQRWQQMQEEAQKVTDEGEQKLQQAKEEEFQRYAEADPSKMQTLTGEPVQERDERINKRQEEIFKENNDAVAESDPRLAASVRLDGTDPQQRLKNGLYDGTPHAQMAFQPQQRDPQGPDSENQGLHSPQSATGVTVHTREELEEIEKREGIEGLRRIATPLGIKGRGKNELIGEIVKAEEQKAKTEGNPDGLRIAAQQNVENAEIKDKNENKSGVVR